MRNPFLSKGSADFGMLLARVPVGIVFIMAGFTKFRMGVGVFVDKSIDASRDFMPEALGRAYLYALPTVELVVGVLIVLGWFTRTTGLVASLILFSIMMAVTGWKDQGSIHSNVVLLGVTLMLLLTGPGGWAMDSVRFKGGGKSKSID